MRSTSYPLVNRSLLLRVVVIAGLLCALPLVGFVTTNSGILPFIALGAILLLTGILILLRRIELGFVGMLLAGVFIRFRIPTGTASELVISMLLCLGIFGLWLVRLLAVDRRLALKPAPVNTPLLAFVVTVFISLGWGWVFRDALVIQLSTPLVLIAAALVLTLLPATLLMVTNLVQDVSWLRAFVWLFLAEGLVTLIISLVIDLGIGPTGTIRELVFRNGFVWVNTQGLFSMWYLAFALALALFNRHLHWAWRIVLLVYSAGWVYWGFVQRVTWLSGWVPAFVAAAVVVFFRSKGFFVVLTVVILVVVWGYYWGGQFQRELAESGLTRWAAYETNWRITGKHLLFGTGPAGYASYYMSYFPTEATASHSNYIDVIAQTGVVGSFFLLWFFGAQIRGGFRLRHRLRNRGDFAESLAVAVTAGTVGCLAAMALGDWLLPFAYTQGIVGFDGAMFSWFFMGLLWALDHNLAPRTHTTVNRPVTHVGE